MKEYRIIFRDNSIDFLYAANIEEAVQKAKKIDEIKMVIREDDCEVVYHYTKGIIKEV